MSDEQRFFIISDSPNVFFFFGEKCFSNVLFIREKYARENHIKTTFFFIGKEQFFFKNSSNREMEFSSPQNLVLF